MEFITQYSTVNIIQKIKEHVFLFLAKRLKPTSYLILLAFFTETAFPSETKLGEKRRGGGNRETEKMRVLSPLSTEILF